MGLYTGRLLVSLATRGTVMETLKLLNVDDLGELRRDNSRSEKQMEVKMVLENHQDNRTQVGQNQPAVESVRDGVHPLNIGNRTLRRGETEAEKSRGSRSRDKYKTQI